MRTLLSLFVFSAVFLAPAAVATDFPTKEIRIIIPFAAGGQSDLTARKLAEVIKKNGYLPQDVLVVNMPGANTMNGLNAVKNARADGYTLLLHHSDIVTHSLYKAIQAHFSDYDMLAQVMQFPFVVSAKGDAPWQDAKEFVADAKANPGKYMIAAPAPGGATYFAGVVFLRAAGLDDVVKIRPAEGGNDAATALMSGAAHIRVASASDSARFVKGGQEKALFVLVNEPSTDYPEANISPDFGAPPEASILMSSGIMAPKGTPDDVKAILKDAIKKAVETKEFQDFLIENTATPMYIDGDAWRELFERNEKVYKEIIQSMTN
ncbi:MAG: tripartite tricarboxylate transporter substrate binding protein [Planctomycetes bacterium]|nr:tripartite tricarboxylate transporter substrate binding protein [Planctomycetota bacterium]